MADAYTAAAAAAAKKQPTESELAEIHKEALERMDEVWEAEQENIREGRECQKFYVGGKNQWDQAAQNARKDRPILTNNLLPKFVRQMTGDLRKNPPSIKYLPSEEGASQETAEVFNGITRDAEQESAAKDCYIVAAENAAIASQGAFRIVTEYVSPTSFDQCVRFKPVRDPFGVLVDPFAQMLDKSDMRYGFVPMYISKKQFEADYEGKRAEDIPLDTKASGFAWRRNDDVCIAEYWKRKAVTAKLYEMPDGTATDKLPAAAKGTTALAPLREREVIKYEVCSYMMTGKEILSGPHEFPSQYIPLCIVVGEEITAEDRTIRKGMIHDARDPQRVCNYARSVTAEAIAMQPRAPFLAAATHITGFEEIWRTAGTDNHSYLPYHIDPQNPQAKPERSQPPIASTGLDSLYAQSELSLEGVIGIYRANLGAPSNETSGIAIRAKQQEGDTGTALYPDNLARALGYAGKILAEVIPRVYDRERQVRVVKEDGTSDMVTVNATTPQVNDKTGQPLPQHNLKDGKYGVVVTTGPTYASRRAEAFVNMVELARGMPIVGQVAPDLVVKHSDAPGAEEMAARLKKALPPGLTEEGPAQPTEPAGPPPDVIAKTEKDLATADKTRAETQKTEVETATMLVQLQASIAQIHQMLAGGAPMQPGLPMGGPGGPPPPGPMPGPPPSPIADVPIGMPPQSNGAAGLPMVDVDAEPEGAPA